VWEDADWIVVAQDREKRRAVLNTAVVLLIP
jgi:hypothetical protein